MAYDIRLIKLVSGELTIGKYDASAKALTEIALLQSAQGQEGVQLMLLPYGYPFEQGFKAVIAEQHFLYTYEELPEDLKDKYLELSSKLTLNSGGLDPNPK